jgi:hypothetical protein
MISHRCVKHLNGPPHAELGKDSYVTMRNQVGNDTSDTVEGYVVDTKSPDEIIYILHVLLVGFWQEQCFDKLTPILDLP